MNELFGNTHGHLVTEGHIQDRNLWLKNNFSSEELAAKTSTRRCVVFAFSRQEPADRWSTRIGGLPAWPVNAPWPDCPKCGDQLAFAGQLDFRGTALRPQVPGDLLVLHYCFECCPWRQEENAAQINWFNEAESTLLIEDEIIPEHLEGDEHGPFYGTAHVCEDVGGSGQEEEDLESADEEERWYHLGATGTKVGGYAAGIHDDEGPEDSTGQQMRFLGMINSTVASDVPKIQDGIRRVACGDLMLADVGCVCFWGSQVGSDFELVWGMSSG